MGNPNLANKGIDFSMFLDVGVTRAMRPLLSSFVNPCLAPQVPSNWKWQDENLILKALTEAAA